MYLRKERGGCGKSVRGPAQVGGRPTIICWRREWTRRPLSSSVYLLATLLLRTRSLMKTLRPFTRVLGRAPTWPVRSFWRPLPRPDRKSTRLNSSHVKISYAVFCLKKKKDTNDIGTN